MVYGDHSSFEIGLYEIITRQFKDTGIVYQELRQVTEPSINHFFEKLLRLEGLMLTEKGKKEAAHRSRVMRLFLKSYFAEEGATDWLNYLAQFDER